MTVQIGRNPKTVDITGIASVQQVYQQGRLYVIGLESQRSFADQDEIEQWRSREPYCFEARPENIVIGKNEFVLFRVTEFIAENQRWMYFCLNSVYAEN